MKLKVLECCTGHKKVEEWTFLPKDWNYDLVLWSKSIHFDKNFALLEFDTRDDPSRDDIFRGGSAEGTARIGTLKWIKDHL